MVPGIFAVLGVLAAVLRCCLAAWLIALVALGKCRHLPGEVGTCQIWLLPAFLVASLWGLDFASCVIFFGYLQCLVGELRGAMCLVGVTRIGDQAEGIVGALPLMISVLLGMKPFQALAGGCLLAFLQGLRYSPNSRLGPWGLSGALCGFAFLAVVEATIESVYLLVPKMEQGWSGGCCVVATGLMNDWMASVRDSQAYGWMCSVGYFSVTSSLAGILLAPTFSAREPWIFHGYRRGSLLLLAGGAVPLAYVFFLDVLVPRVIKGSYHRCVFDLWNYAPESLLGVVSVFLAGCFVSWWAVFVATVGDDLLGAEAKSLASRLQFIAGVAYASAVSLSVMELVVS